MICIDSDCIIDFLKGKPGAINAINDNKERIITTEINKFEVLFGVYKRREMNEQEIESANDFFDNIISLPFGEGCAEIAAQQLGALSKDGNIIDSHDALVGAILTKNECSEIITKNAKDYLRIEGIKVISY